MTREQLRRGIPYLLVVGLSIGLYALGSYETSSQVGDVNSRVTKVESPCLKYGPKSKLCQESFEKALGTLTHPEACAVERKAGTLKAVRELATGLGVTFTEPCVGARLAQERQRGNERAATRQLQATPNPSKSLDNSSSEGEQGSAGVNGPVKSGNGPGKDHSSPASHHPTSNPSPAPSPAGGQSGTAPEQTGSGSSAPPSTETSSAPVAGGSTSTSSESVVESTQTHVEEVVTGTGELLHTTVCGLTAPLLCPKR